MRINSTCTVFAGAELRERLSLGEKREDILAGLHRAIILRAMSLLARSGGVADEFTFTGGVAKNPAAVDALRKLVLENYGESRHQHLARTRSTPARSARRCSRCATGAAERSRGGGSMAWKPSSAMRSRGHRRGLRRHQGRRDRGREASGDAPARGRRPERIRRRDPHAVTEELFHEDAGPRRASRARDLDYVATTGEGELVPFRTGHFYGMTTHARGGLFLEPEARAVIDIGALHTRAVLMDERGKVLGYRMTSQCASGSGQFLENIARYLGVTLEEIGPLSLQADDPEACSSICAVLAETDVINMVSRGISVANILKGIHQSMAGRYLRLLTSAGAMGVVLVTGGLAADVGLLAALREAAKEQGADRRSRPRAVGSRGRSGRRDLGSVPGAGSCGRRASLSRHEEAQR